MRMYILVNSVLMGLALAIFITLIFIAIHGGATIVEPNSGILYGELLLMLTIIIICIYNLVKLRRR